MTNSPLDGSFESSKKRLKPKWVLALIALIGTAIGGGVFALSITINTNDTVEFGQGFAAITTCDREIDVTPVSVFNGTSFKLTEVILKDFDSDTCEGKTIIVKALSTDAPPTEIAAVTTTAPAGTGPSVEATIAFGASPDATLVGTITVESQD
jgi:hypothetical protein